MTELLAASMLLFTLAFADTIGDLASPGKQCRVGSPVSAVIGC